MTRSRYRFLGNDAPYFLTMTINQWLPVFTRPATVEVILDSWRYLQTHHAFQLHGYVILENHLHLVARAPELDRDVQRFKSTISTWSPSSRSTPRWKTTQAP